MATARKALRRTKQISGKQKRKPKPSLKKLREQRNYYLRILKNPELIKGKTIRIAFFGSTETNASLMMKYFRAFLEKNRFQGNFILVDVPFYSFTQKNSSPRFRKALDSDIVVADKELVSNAKKRFPKIAAKFSSKPIFRMNEFIKPDQTVLENLLAKGLMKLLTKK